MNRRTWSRPVALALALTLTAAACGGGDDDDGGGDDGGSASGELSTAAGFDGTTIRLGVITPTSGDVAIIGNPLTAGNQAYFDYVNEELGGVAGEYPIELDIRDSQYDATRAGTEYQSLKEDTVMIAQLLGTPSVNAVLESLVEDDVVAAPASLDSFWVREPNLLPVGGPYQIQAINAVNWYVTEGDGEGKKVCSLIADDPYGAAGQEGVAFAAEQLDLDLGPAVEFPAAANTPEAFTAPIGELQREACEMVFFVGTPRNTGPALGVAAQLQYAPQWIAQSPAWVGALASSAVGPYLEANLLVASEGPNYGDESVEGMAELLRIKSEYASAEYQPDDVGDVYFNFGYLQAKAVHALLEKAVELGDLSHEGVLQALEELGTLSFDGLSGDYTYGPAEDRVPPITSSLFSVDPASPTGLTLREADLEAPFAGDFEFADG